MAATPTIPNKIVLDGQDGWKYFEKPCYTGVTTLLPGMFVQRNSSDNAIIQATAGGAQPTYVAREQGLSGGTTATAYVPGDPVMMAAPSPGCIANVMLTYGVAYNVGDILIFAGDGSLKHTTGTPLRYIAEIEQAIDLTSAGVNSLGIVRFM